MIRNTVSRQKNGSGPDLTARLSAWGLALLFGVTFSFGAQSSSPTEPSIAQSALPAELSNMGWLLLDVPGKETAEFTYRGPGTIDISADNAVAFLYRPVDETDGSRSRLAWSWRVDKAVPPTDLSRDGGDDRSLAVHVVFPIDRDQLSLWENLETSLTELVAPPLAGKVLTYVWGGNHPQGAVMANPYFDTQGKIIVLRTGDEPVGQWMMEEIDFEADFLEAFGYDAPTPIFIAISSDSDDTGSRTIGAVANLTFVD